MWLYSISKALFSTSANDRGIMPRLEMSLELRFFPERQQGKERQRRTPWVNVSYALCWEDPLEEGGHSNPLQYSCLENPRTEEPGGLQYAGRRVGNN